MSDLKGKRIKRARRHKRVRAKIVGTSERPRLSIFRSNKHVCAQLINDSNGRTVVSASGWEVIAAQKTKRIKSRKELSQPSKSIIAEKVGELIAQKALEGKIASVVFDRGGYKYHGIVKAVADGARKGGLKF